jgi:hypothetical protein
VGSAGVGQFLREVSDLLAGVGQFLREASDLLF